MFQNLFGTDVPLAARFLTGLVIFVGLICATVWLVRRFGARRPSAPPTGGRQPQLAVIDVAAVDARRRLILIRRDGTEHLMMIGGPSDVLIEANIVPAARVREAQAPHPPAAGDMLPRTEPPGGRHLAAGVGPRAAEARAPGARAAALRAGAASRATDAAATAARESTIIARRTRAGRRSARPIGRNIGAAAARHTSERPSRPAAPTAAYAGTAARRARAAVAAGDASSRAAGVGPAPGTGAGPREQRGTKQRIHTLVAR